MSPKVTSQKSLLFYMEMEETLTIISVSFPFSQMTKPEFRSVN